MYYPFKLSLLFYLFIYLDETNDINNVNSGLLTLEYGAIVDSLTDYCVGQSYPS